MKRVRRFTAAILWIATVIVLAVGWYGFGRIFDNTILFLLLAGLEALMIGMVADLINLRLRR